MMWMMPYVHDGQPGHVFWNWDKKMRRFLTVIDVNQWRFLPTTFQSFVHIDD